MHSAHLCGGLLFTVDDLSEHVEPVSIDLHDYDVNLLICHTDNVGPSMSPAPRGFP